jgi:SAM-dependent methyltransferase
MRNTFLKIDHTDSYRDFGEQFLVDSKIDGYFGSQELLSDIVKPFDLREINGSKVMEVGCGSGRILKNLLEYRPKKIFAIEPSKAINVAKENNKNGKIEIEYENIKGEEIDKNDEIDFCFSIGVLHHIPNANIVVKNIFNALKINGKGVFWVYGYEGNELYLAFFNNLRRITRIIPDSILRYLCSIINLFCSLYIVLAKFFPLPLKAYMINIFQNFSWKKRNYVIFDQLNPSFAKYYKKSELESLINNAGFSILDIVHRHGYSWTIICEKK